MIFPNSKIGSLIVLACCIAGTCQGQTVEIDPIRKSPEMIPVMKRVESYEASVGVPPDIIFFYETIESLNGLTGSQQLVLQAELNNRQKPIISLQDLIEILKAKRDSIDSFDCNYTSSIPEVQQRRYAFSDNKIYTETNGKNSSLQVDSYDGVAFRTLYSIDQVPHGTVIQDGGLTSFLVPSMPLSRMILSDMTLTGSVNPLIDLPEFLSGNTAVVYQKTYQIDGSECLLASNGVSDIYLDIDRNFAVVRLDNFVNEVGEVDENGVLGIKRRKLTQKTVLSEFQDYGNGLELPTKILTEVYDNSESPPKVALSETVQVEKLEINPDLPDSLFSDIFPDDTNVQDDVRGLVYQQGQRDSIEKMVFAGRPGGSGCRAQKWRATFYALQIVVLCVIVGLLVAIYRRKSEG